MAITYVCSFDHYGPAVGSRAGTIWHIGADQLLGDGWISLPSLNKSTIFTGTYDISTPAWGARSGDYALVSNGAGMTRPAADFYAVSGIESLRMVFPGATAARRLIHFAFSISDLPLIDKAYGHICSFLNGANGLRASLAVTPAGRLQVLDHTGMKMDGETYSNIPNVLASSSAPVIQPHTWYFFSIDLTINIGGTADIAVYLGDIVLANKVLEGTALAFTGTGNIDILGFLPASLYAPSSSGDDTIRAVRDIVIADTTGTYNNALLGQCFVSAQEMRQEDAEGAGWTANHRENLGDGILDSHTNHTGLRAADAAALEVGASDFTFESWVRFHTLPGVSAEANLIAKWRANDNNRSYRLVYYGSDNTIRWEVSTDGITAITVKDLPWVPITDKWYHVAVSRASGQTMLFINGVQFGVPVADTNTYFDGVGTLGVAARYDGTSTLIANSGLDGWMDETRFTVGVARYTSDFSPSLVKFGRNVVDDPSFANVVLLLGYDSLSLADESSYGRTMSTTNPPLTAIQPDDGDNSYNVLNNRPYIDDTYIEAAQTFAEGIFTFDTVPTATETMTIGAKTYTWVTALTAANQVLIGVDIDACISNIIAAINNGAGEGTVYGTGTTPNLDASADTFVTPQFIVRALTIGAAGNSVVTTDTMASGYFSAVALTGGQDIPADSDFAIERLPSDVTGILGVQMTTRHYKTDAGTASVRIDLVGPAGAVAAGADTAPDLNPAWARQIFEQDPDTMANLTPSTMIGGRMRFKRTV